MNVTLYPTNHTTSTTQPITTTPSPYSCGLDLRRGELPLILLITLVVNSMSVVVLWRMRGMSDSVDHLLISILNLNDLSTTVIFTTTWIAGWSTCGDILLVDGVCGFLGWLNSAMVVWSAFIILIMTSLRYLSMVKPFYYRRHVNTSTVIKSSIGTFIFCLVLFLFPLTGVPRPYALYTQNLICAVDFAPGGYNVWHRTFIGFVGTLGVTTVIFVTVCNLLIVKSSLFQWKTGITPASAAVQRRKLQDNLKGKDSMRLAKTITTLSSGSTKDQYTNIKLSSHNMVHTSSISTITTMGRANPNMTSQRSRRLSKRRIFQRVTLVVSFVYVMCYAPFVIRLVVDTIYDRDNQDGLHHSVTLILLFMAPLLNPFVYGLFNRYFRKTLIDMIRCRTKSGVETSSTYSNNGAVETLEAG